MIVETSKNEQTGKYEVDIKTNGIVAELEANKEVSIDVSQYSAPVEITPSSGKDGMEKATVTLTNISSGGGGSTTYYCWSNSLASNYMYLPFSVAPNEAPSSETTIIEPFSASSKFYIKKGTLDVPEEAVYTKISDTEFQYQIGNTLSIFTRDSTKDFTF